MPSPPLQRSWHSLAMLVVLVVLALFPASSNAYTLSSSSCLGRQRALVMKAGDAGSENPLSQSPSPSCSRADVLRGGVAVLSGATLTSLVAAPWGVRPATAAEEEKEKVESSTFIPFVASSKTFTFDYPDSWKLAPKLVQTHQEEVTLKSTVQRGFSAGVAVDPVRIERIEQTGTPAEVGGRIVNLEGKKEGVQKVELLDSAQEGNYYTFDYRVESTRGKNRFLAKAVINAQKLVVFTVQVPIPAYEPNQAIINHMLASFQAPPPAEGR